MVLWLATDYGSQLSHEKVKPYNDKKPVGCNFRQAFFSGNNLFSMQAGRKLV